MNSFITRGWENELRAITEKQITGIRSQNFVLEILMTLKFILFGFKIT